MVTFWDILIHLILGISYFIISCFILILTDYPYLIIICFITYVIIHVNLKRRKKLTKHLKEDFEKLGYVILEERPLKLSESKLSIKPAILVNGIPVSRYGYIRRFARVFRLKDNNNELFEVQAILTKEWGGNNAIRIIKKLSLKNTFLSINSKE